uniref:SCAN box domain-containing protein n=1 Tax=Chelonoidis abingdonii TaxID=106734 RepID=A0A8C0H319_CHEAB
EDISLKLQMQSAYRNLDLQEALDYSKVKAAIGDQMGINHETYPVTHVQIAETVALEQLQTLPTGATEWVQQHCPKTLAEVTSIMEDYLAAEGEGKTGLGRWSTCPEVGAW